MTQQKQKYQAYNAATHTVAKTKQIVMLYDGAIRYVRQAREAIGERRIEDRYNLLTKAADIVAGLQGCLDFDQGGDLAKSLYSYYSSINNRIFSIHRNNSIETCDQVIADLKQMRDSWAEIDQGTIGEGKAEAPAQADTSTKEAPAPIAFEPNVTLSA